MDYRPELDAAVQAALEAGALLRDEFHRPGGPRGNRNHADVDTEAEVLIHDRLSREFPHHGYFGEELKLKIVPQSGGPAWLVDPNDGTSAFVAGYRGAAVSIGLVHEGRPVLGVVYAYSAPDDAGDLFTWAEGCGPIQRNGRAVERLWNATISTDRTVLLAHPADRNQRANGEAVSPMRFRGVPSIAYRLALVAAGEGDATVSLQAPNDWDYAAGHALMIGAGADVYDSAGRPIRYSRLGRSTAKGSCFAGGLPVVQYLVRRDWSAVFKRSSEPDPLCRPAAGLAVSDPALLARAQGCLLGQLCGDALGSLVEFKTAVEIAREYLEGVRFLRDGGTFDTIAGQPTDDSEMALALGRMIVREERYEAESVRRAYKTWYESQPFDIGSTTRAALRGSADVRSQANGALMRVSPIGIAGAGVGIERAAGWARDDARLTHPNPVCVDANVVFVAAIAHAIGTGDGPAGVHRKALDYAREPAVREALSDAEHRAPADYQKQQGWALIALQNAFYRLLHAQSFEDGVVATVMSGGDTDTNTAIAGALLGAVHGRAAVPPQWVDRVLTCRPMHGLPGVQRPRPARYWPVDALCLAERLLLLA